MGIQSFASAKYRLYVDEVGNSDLDASHQPNHRYLSLTGVVLELGYVATTVAPALELLKRQYFGSHPDEPVILHRKELLNKRHPFEALRDGETEQRFNADLLNLLTTIDYTVITVVIDKLEHKQRYTTWRFDPYHYCLTVLVERFATWLKRAGTFGDVMAESRGGKDDLRLKRSFERVVTIGSDYVKPEEFAAHLTSKQLKVKPKSNNIAGLQFADLIAHPSYRAVLARHQSVAIPDNFGGRIAHILETSKYDRSSSGRVEGWGAKVAPLMEKRPRRAAEGICLPPPGNWINHMVASQEISVNTLGRDFFGALCRLGLTVGATTLSNFAVSQ